VQRANFALDPETFTRSLCSSIVAATERAGALRSAYIEKMKRVLVVYSWDDDISQMRYNRMCAITPTAHIAFEQCFAVSRPMAKVKASALFERIATAIQQFNPEILLIHTGAAFQSAPDEFVECLGRLHKVYPRLRLGYERRHDPSQLSELDVFDNSEDTQHVERVVFG
jgi:hypothetical protein